MDFFKFIRNFYAGIACQEQSKYGESIAWMQSAVNILNEANTSYSYEDFEDILTEALSLAELKYKL